MLPNSDPQLARWYKKAKEKFFLDGIPDVHQVSLRWEHPGRADGCVTDEGEGLFSIQLDPALRVHKCLARIVLYHEMAHLSIWPNQKHGRAFKQVLERLWEEGAYKGLL